MMASKGQILIVDDAPEVRLLVRGVLEAESFQVHMAENAAEALSCLEQFAVDLMLLDLDLPDVQGTTLCRQLRDGGSRLPIVMLTCHNHGHERAAGLDCGADDYIGKPFLPEELLARVRAQLRREERFSKRTEELLRERWDRINDGLKLAQQIQQPFSKQRLNHISSAVRHVPVGRIGGDFFLLEEIDEYRSAVAIGDTMGKGVGASLVMSWTLSMAYELIHKGLGPRDLVSQMSQNLGPDLEEIGVFLAFFYGVYDRRSGEFSYCSAGSEPPIWIRRESPIPGEGRLHRRLSTAGIPVGVLRDFAYEEKKVHPGAGDQLFLFTDGLSESVPVENQPALMRSMYRVLLQSRNQPVSSRAETLMQCLRFNTNQNLFLRDDLTFVLLEFPAPCGHAGEAAGLAEVLRS